ncbi:MAG TPA: hypothetical protein VD902_04020, partial [Symbiobacteriaceae bacterium]|nr:hypothetical protein [Symbiobacteriaceae bacterium]
MLLLNWEQAQAAGPAIAGGKGWNLGRLHRYGFPVPGGGVVSSDAYRLFTGHPDLQPLLDRAAHLSIADAAEPEAVAVLEQLRAAM